MASLTASGAVQRDATGPLSGAGVQDDDVGPRGGDEALPVGRHGHRRAVSGDRIGLPDADRGLGPPGAGVDEGEAHVERLGVVAPVAQPFGRGHPSALRHDRAPRDPSARDGGGRCPEAEPVFEVPADHRAVQRCRVGAGAVRAEGDVDDAPAVPGEHLAELESRPWPDVPDHDASVVPDRDGGALIGGQAQAHDAARVPDDPLPDAPARPVGQRDTAVRPEPGHHAAEQPGPVALGLRAGPRKWAHPSELRVHQHRGGVGLLGPRQHRAAVGRHLPPVTGHGSRAAQHRATARIEPQHLEPAGRRGGVPSRIYQDDQDAAIGGPADLEGYAAERRRSGLHWRSAMTVDGQGPVGVDRRDAAVDRRGRHRVRVDVLSGKPRCGCSPAQVPGQQ